MKKPVKIIIISVIILIVLGLIIVPKIISTKEKSGTTQRQNTDQTIQVDVYVIKTQPLSDEIKSIGTIKANEEAEIRSEVSRKITGIFFKEGTFVRKGQTLFKLDDEDLNAKVYKLELQEKLAVTKLEREKQLIEKGLTPQEEFDILENSLEQIRADLEITDIDISKTYVRAPFSGIIGLRNISNGSYVTPNFVLTKIQDVSKVKVDFSIPEKYFPYFKKGQSIKFKVDGIDEEFSGTVYAYEPKIEDNTRSLIIRAVCNNPASKLLPGTFANVTFKVDETNDAILIPTQALVPKLKGQSVYVIKDGKARSVDVEIGERTEEFVQITSYNLREGDSVISTNILRLKDGEGVKVK